MQQQPIPIQFPLAPKKPNKERKIAWLIFGLIMIIGLAANRFVTAPEIDINKGSLFGEFLAPIVFQEQFIEGEGEDKIAIIKLQGIISDIAESDFLGGSSGVFLSDIMHQLDQARDDKLVKSVIVRVDSPGGTVTASQTLSEKITDLKKHGKKVVALMREVAASGGYYVAAPADKIVANPSTITGSIGVIFQSANLEELYKKVGYQPVTIKSGRLKDIGSSDRAMTEEERTILQKLLDEDHDRFINAVATGRKMAKSKVVELADGRIFSGAQAKNLGLVDELGNLPKAIEVAKKEAKLEQATVVEYITAFSVLEELGSFFFGAKSIERILNQLSPSKSQGLSGMLYLWQP